METTISPIFNKTLFQRLLDSRKSNTEVIYFDKTTTINGESQNKIFNLDDTIFYNDVLKSTYNLSNTKLINGLPSKCSVGQSFSADNNEISNSTNGTVNVKIKELKE